MESTLTLTRSAIEGKVGLYLGWGAGADSGDRTWTDRQAREIKDCVESGLRRFYYPSPAYTGGMSIVWGFLHPFATMQLVQGQRTILLPGNFGGVDESQIFVTDNSARLFMPIRIEGPGVLENLYAMNPAYSGRPQVCAIEPLKGITHDRGQQFQLRVFPEPDTGYTLRFQYYFLPNYPDGTEAFAYGGAEHVETILESCLAVAEERRDDRPGVHLEAFKRQLLASMAMDRKKKPQRIGQNLDHSDDYQYGYNRYDYARTVTINGIAYD